VVLLEEALRIVKVNAALLSPIKFSLTNFDPEPDRVYGTR
jgi:hypothetical protein